MPMALGNVQLTISRRRPAPLFEHTIISPQPHRAAIAILAHIFGLLGIEVNNRMRRLVINLHGVRSREPEHMTSKLNRRQLHAVAKTQIRNLFLPRELNRRDNPLDPARAKSARDNNSVIAGALFYFGGFLLILLGVNPIQERARVVMPGRVLDGLNY